MRERTGSIRVRDGKLFARVTWTDSTGRRRELNRKASSRTEARSIIRKLLKELDDGGVDAVDAGKVTFAELADQYEQDYLVPALYVGDRKIAGLRDYSGSKYKLRALRDYFASRRVREITYADLEAFRRKRLATPTQHGGQRQISTVNRELSLLRRIFNVAKRRGLLMRSPFECGESLIRPGDEKPRQRVLTWEEESRLLAACTGKRAHLRAIIVCALDCGLRRSEILKLTWRDVDLEKGLLNIVAINTKSLRARQVAITNRLGTELRTLADRAASLDAVVFEVPKTCRNAFEGARRAAGLHDLHFHDLRACHASRLIAANVPLASVSALLGHSSPSVTLRHYVRLSDETARRAADALNCLYEEAEKTEDAFVN